MAILPNVFKPDEEIEDPFKPLDEGWYEMEVIKSVYKANNAKNGHYISLSVKVLEEPYEGRLLYPNLNIDNPNKTTVTIAQRDLQALSIAVGVGEDWDDTEVLHDIPFFGFVVVKPKTSQWPAKNELKKFLSMEAYEELDSD